MDEDGIRAAFHSAVATVDPPVQRLVAGAIARGRHSVLVTRVGVAVSATAVLGGVAALAVALLPGGAASRHAAVRAGAPSAGTRATNAVSSTAVPPPATVTMTPQALLQTALDTLPRPGTTSKYAGNFDDNGFVGTQFVYDDGHGAAQVMVAMQYPPPHPTPHSADLSACRPSADGCTVLPDGAHAQSFEGPEYPYAHDPNATERDVDLVRSDGVEVSISEWNAPQEKDAAISRPEPPFTIDELITWADSAKWQVQISQQRADASAGLFNPVDLRALAGKQLRHDRKATRKHAARAQRKLNCLRAKQIHKPAPPYCH